MTKEWDILFLGRLFPKLKEKEIRKKAYVDMQDAANVLEWNIINGLLQNGVSNIHTVSFLPIDSWPKYYKDPFISYAKEEYDNNCTFETVGFCNVMYIKQILGANACTKAAVRWAKRKSDLPKAIICYSCNNVLMRAVAAVKKINPNIKVIQVIADITEFAANADLSTIMKLYIDSQIKKNDELSKFIDGYVLLTEQMKDKLGINKPYMVMEGIVPEREHVANESSNVDKKKILYTGSMNKKYGILQLLEAFSKIENSNYELILCGLGNAEDEIRKYCRRDSRIKYLGKVPHDEVLKLQSQATAVVNPRQNNEEFTKYSFPSKNLEYLSSGIPLVAYKLDGIPDEYDAYIHYVPDNSIEALAETIAEVCEMISVDRVSKAEKARKFVLEEKNSKKQTEKILNLLKQLN